MRLLLDTQAWLWWLSDPARLLPRALAAIRDERNEVFVSVASAWEIAIKRQRGRVWTNERLERCLPDWIARDGFRVLPIELEHVLQLGSRPFINEDPIDRLLLMQARARDLTLLTGDPRMLHPWVSTFWARRP